MGPALAACEVEPLAAMSSRASGEPIGIVGASQFSYGYVRWESIGEEKACMGVCRCMRAHSILTPNVSASQLGST
eukprot:CAMPEP_0196663948 /NCGR_PEP_ID=MMETSP1086-20130531/54929_1 /TAXON_ID=77921 /ORGANISM="Cyanoptyche  gloeocystis , Strain SAG4.97" /LENGTH=74 /DNA_ID=CAMNT_0041999981 /DNA_START=236 /DNA_END=457 /DNA_ORIENTATION=-